MESVHSTLEVNGDVLLKMLSDDNDQMGWVSISRATICQVVELTGHFKHLKMHCGERPDENAQ